MAICTKELPPVNRNLRNQRKPKLSCQWKERMKIPLLLAICYKCIYPKFFQNSDILLVLVVRVRSNVSRVTIVNAIWMLVDQPIPSTFSFACVFNASQKNIRKLHKIRGQEFKLDRRTAHVPGSFNLICGCRSAEDEVRREPQMFLFVLYIIFTTRRTRETKFSKTESTWVMSDLLWQNCESKRSFVTIAKSSSDDQNYRNID